jgi:hypothetical protein
MTKFVIRETSKTEQEPEKTIEFWLEFNSNNRLVLCAHDTMDTDKAPYYILRINKNGLFRFARVGEDLGFPIDKNGKINLDE